jgi:hypothetical protein
MDLFSMFFRTMSKTLFEDTSELRERFIKTILVRLSLRGRNRYVSSEKLDRVSPLELLERGDRGSGALSRTVLAWEGGGRTFILDYHEGACSA